MWHIYDCLYRDRWASHRPGSTVKRNVCESDVQPQILGCSRYESWGGCWPTACAPSIVWLVWACLRTGLTTVYYLYHLRGLTGLGLVLFHPNIIILWLYHNWIGVGELVVDLHMQMAMFGSMFVISYIAIGCDLLICKCLLLVHPWLTKQGS